MKSDILKGQITIDEWIKTLPAEPVSEIRVFGRENGLETWKSMHCSECKNAFKSGKEKYCKHVDCTKNGYSDFRENRVTDNDIICHLIDDIKKRFPGKVHDVSYDVWPHVPRYGKRLWLSADDIGHEYDLTDIVEKYKKYSLEVSVTPIPGFDDEGIDLYISTTWKTKGYKEVTGYIDKPVCAHSGHECNKQELWKVAEGCDVECPHVCCRLCMVKGCGARCNGSHEPKEIRKWHRACKQLPDKSGYYEILDIKATRGKAWFEKTTNGFDHVTGHSVEAWRVLPSE